LKNAPSRQHAGAGSCRCETVRSHSGSHVRLSRMQSVSLLSDFMRSSCTAQLLHSAAPAQRSSCTAQLLLSAALAQRCISSQRARVRRCAGAAKVSCTSRNYRASWSRPATASPHCLRPSATRGAARGWQGWERVWRGVHTACLPTLPTFCAPLVPQHPPFPRQFLGRLLSQCALLAADVCGCHGVATCVVACSEQHGPGRVRPRVRACAAVHGLSFSSRSPSP